MDDMAEQVTNQVSRTSTGLHSMQSLGWGAVAMQQLGQLINWTGSEKFVPSPVDPWTALVVVHQNNGSSLAAEPGAQAGQEKVAEQVPPAANEAEEAAKAEAAAKEQAAIEQAANEQAAKEQAANEQAAKEQAAKDLANKIQAEQREAEQREAERVASEKAAAERLSMEEAARKKSASEAEAASQEAARISATVQAAREQAQREQAQREQAQREQAQREQAQREQAAQAEHEKTQAAERLATEAAEQAEAAERAKQARAATEERERAERDAEVIRASVPKPMPAATVARESRPVAAQATPKPPSPALRMPPASVDAIPAVHRPIAADRSMSGSTDGSLDTYLAQLEHLVLELNMELGRRRDQATSDPLQDLSQRVIDLNLENLALKEQLRLATGQQYE